MRYKRLFICVVLFLCICGCGDEIVVSRQALEIVSPSDAIVTAPPDAVWEGLKISTERTLATWKRLYPLEVEDFVGGLTPAQLENHERFKRNLERKMDGVPLDEFDLLALQKAFYTKYIDAGGIAILANATVEDTHLIEARRVVLTMTAKRPALRDHLLVQHGFYMVLLGRGTLYEDVPESTQEGPIYTFGCSMSAVPGVLKNGYCYATVGHITSRAYLYAFAHEFAHALESEMERLRPGFQDRVKQAYENAEALGIWPLEVTRGWWREYWAEGVELWFYEIGPSRQSETYAEFAAREPVLAELMGEELWSYENEPDREFETYEAFFERDPLLAELLDEWFPRIALPRHY